MAAALQSAAIPGQRAAEVAVDRQRTGAAAAALFGAVNAIAWIAYFVSHATGEQERRAEPDETPSQAPAQC